MIRHKTGSHSDQQGGKKMTEETGTIQAELQQPAKEQQEEVKVQKNVENIKNAVTMKETSEQLSQKSKDLFNELFGDKE